MMGDVSGFVFVYPSRSACEKMAQSRFAGDFV
jgi:hypothetical protein